MSSFYGNIKFNNQTPLIFDKIYSSRYDMEKNCSSDGIFNGRFILISYCDIQYTPYHRIDPIGTEEYNNLIASGTDLYIINSEAEDGFSLSTGYSPYVDYYIRREYGVDNTSIFALNKSKDEKYYKHDYHNTVWQKIWTSTQSSEEVKEKYIMISHLNAETPQVKMIVDAPSDAMGFIDSDDEARQIYFPIPTDQDKLNVSGIISKEYFDTHKDSIYLKIDSTGNLDNDYKRIPVYEEEQGVTIEWNILQEYYELDIETLVYNKINGSKAYVDGMISEELFVDLTTNRKIPIFITVEQALEDVTLGLDQIIANYNSEIEKIDKTDPKYEELLLKVHSDFVDQINELSVLKEQKQKAVDDLKDINNAIAEQNKNIIEENKRIEVYNQNVAEEYKKPFKPLIEYVVKYDVAKFWNRLSKYYFMRFREYQGRPHFDPIMSTDLEYKFHMPRNWKWDNNLDFDYNIQGFYPEQAHNLNTKNNSIEISILASGDEYPIHRKDEPAAAVYNEDLKIVTAVQPDTKHFNFNLQMLGDAVSKMWDIVYPPKTRPSEWNSERDLYIGNDRLRPENDQENYPETLAEAIRKLYYWLGLNADAEKNIKGDNNFKYGPWVDPNTGEEVDTIFGVLNGASDLLGSFGDVFSFEAFVPVASPYYPDGFGQLKDNSGFTQLTKEEFDLLHNGGAGPLYIKIGENQYDWATEYDYNQQYYRNMNSLMSILRAWQDIVKDTQGDWTYEGPDEDWIETNPIHPRFIRNKPMVLSVDNRDRIDGELYEIEDISTEKVEELVNKNIEVYGTRKYLKEIQKVEDIYGEDGSYKGQGTVTTYEDVEELIRIYSYPAEIESNLINDRIESPYFEKHILDPTSINWFWKNYAI